MSTIVKTYHRYYEIDISKKTVPKYKIDILIQKGIFMQRRRFVCDDCLNMYGQSKDSDDIVSEVYN